MIFLDKRLHLVTGKGGVGRTTVTVALGLAAAERGKRVLITEMGDPEGGYSALGRHFGLEKLTDKPQCVAPGIDACHLWGATGHELFGRSIIPAGPLIQAGLRSRALQGFAMATPGVYELGIFYHLLQLVEAKSKDGRPLHDFVVVDMPATGHALALTKLPGTVLSLMPHGPIAAAMRRGQSILYNESKCAAWVVTLPERLPVSESLELLEGLRETSIPVGGAILNRIRADPFDAGEREALQHYLDSQAVMGQVAFGRAGSAKGEIERMEQQAGGPVVRLPNVVGKEGLEIGKGLSRALLAPAGATP